MKLKTKVQAGLACRYCSMNHNQTVEKEVTE